MRWRSPDPTARCSPKAWCGCLATVRRNGWVAAATSCRRTCHRSSSIAMTSSLYAEPMNSPLGDLARRVKAASRVVAQSSTSVRNDALKYAADLLEEEWAALVEANRSDVASAESGGMVASSLDRLRLDEARVRAMAAGLRGVVALGDPVGEVVDGWV